MQRVAAGDSATLILEEESATLQTVDGRRVMFPATPGPYLKYQEAVGTPGPILAVVRGESLMACVEEIEPFLRERHKLVKSGWEYMPRVQMRVSSTEGRLMLQTTRDQGFSRTGENAEDLHDDNLPDWEHSVSCPADVTNIEDGGSFRVDLNHDFLKTIVEALKDAAEEIRIYFEHREAPLHFAVGEEHHAAVLMPLRIGS